MDRTPKPVSLAAARALPVTPGRSTEIFVDGDLELRFAGAPTSRPQIPHPRDELYIVASGTAHYHCDAGTTEVGPGDLLFAAARSEHGFDNTSPDFTVWVLFYGPEK